MKRTIKLILAFYVATLFLACTSSEKVEKVKPPEPEFVPEWSKKVVWYQVFPERFKNGDPKNDPRVEDQKNSWPDDIKSPWKLSPWGSDWYELQPWEKKGGKDIWYNIQRRRYGGDLQGLIDKLDYIKELGIGAIYLNPIFTSPSLHKYDGASYHHVDPTFGPDPEGDKKMIQNEVFDDPSTWVWTSADKLALKLFEEVHKRGMKIILDGVFNHMGLNCLAFQDVIKNQEKSKYKDWFTILSWDDPKKGTKFDYQGWFGVKTLPELREDSLGIVQGPKDYIFASTKRWMTPEVDGKKVEGCDGWRLDVAFCVAHNFWKDWRKYVKSLNPDAYMTAEIVDSIKVNQQYLKGDEFDGVMNYNFAFITSEFFINKKQRITATEFDKKMTELVNAFRGGANYAVQNLMDSHDSHRLVSFIVNADLGKFSDWSKGFFDLSKGSNPNYNTAKPTEEDYKIQKLVAIFQMTCLGAPMVYYGDEVGMWGANDPCPRKPMIWEELKYNDEILNADGSKRKTPDKVEVNKDLLNFYKKIISIRNANAPLQIGDYKTVFVDDQKSVYVFSRNFENQQVLVAINNSNSEQTIEFDVKQANNYTDVLNDNLIISPVETKLKLTIKPLWALILTKNK
jgi:glycosidase